jgi:hypothetical protein
MGLRPTQGDEKRLLSEATNPWKRGPHLCHPEAKPRDLQFRGPFLETRNLVPPQNCHLDRSVAQWRDLRFYRLIKGLRK